MLIKVQDKSLSKVNWGTDSIFHRPTAAILRCNIFNDKTMLYQIFETQRSLMEPFADFAQAASKLYGQANSPIAQNPMSQRVSAGYDLLLSLINI